MRVVLFVLSAVALLWGFSVLAAAKSAIHEIEAFVMFLIAAVLLSGAGVVDAIIALRNDLMPGNGSSASAVPIYAPIQAPIQELSESQKLAIEEDRRPEAVVFTIVVALVLVVLGTLIAYNAGYRWAPEQWWNNVTGE